MSNVHFSSKTNEWATPQDFFDKLDAEFGFTLDPCATHANAKCVQYFIEAQDGLAQNWSSHTVFVNPPYGRAIRKWIEKAYNASRLGATVVMLIPARTDTKAWHDFIFGKAEIRFIRGRLKFGDSNNSAPFPSAVVIFRPGKSLA